MLRDNETQKAPSRGGGGAFCFCCPTMGGPIRNPTVMGGPIHDASVKDGPTHGEGAAGLGR